MVVRWLPVNIGHPFELLRDERRTVREQNAAGCQFAKEGDAVGVEKRDAGKIEYKIVSAVPVIPQRIGAHTAQLLYPWAGNLAFEP